MHESSFNTEELRKYCTVRLGLPGVQTVLAVSLFGVPAFPDDDDTLQPLSFPAYARPDTVFFKDFSLHVYAKSSYDV